MYKPILGVIAALALVVAIAARADTPPAIPSPEDALVVQVKDLKWTPATTPGIPAGVQGSRVAGDPKTGPSIAYAKVPPGVGIPSHWHTYAEYTVLISGSERFVIDGKSYDIGPGSYLVIPAKAKHQLTCNPGAECIALTRRAGPVDYNFEK